MILHILLNIAHLFNQETPGWHFYVSQLGQVHYHFRDVWFQFIFYCSFFFYTDRMLGFFYPMQK